MDDDAETPWLWPSGPLARAMLPILRVPTETVVVGLDVTDQPAVATAIDLAKSFGGQSTAGWRGAPDIPTLNLLVRVQLGLRGLDYCEFVVPFDPTQHRVELAQMAESGRVAFSKAPLVLDGRRNQYLVVQFDGPGLAKVLARRGRKR